MRRVGLFGGTFDPPHLGHLAIAEWAREQLGLERVVFMPAGAPPHKRRRDLSRAEAPAARGMARQSRSRPFLERDPPARRRGTIDPLPGAGRGRALHRAAASLSGERVSYRPREFWDRRLSEQFDLRGTGETGLSLAYN